MNKQFTNTELSNISRRAGLLHLSIFTLLFLIPLLIAGFFTKSDESGLSLLPIGLVCAPIAIVAAAVGPYVYLRQRVKRAGFITIVCTIVGIVLSPLGGCIAFTVLTPRLNK